VIRSRRGVHSPSGTAGRMRAELLTTGATKRGGSKPQSAAPRRPGSVATTSVEDGSGEVLFSGDDMFITATPVRRVGLLQRFSGFATVRRLGDVQPGS